MLKLAFIIVSILITVPLFRAAYVFAQSPLVLQAPPQTSISTGGISALITMINAARDWIFGILLSVVVVFILLAAFNFLTSGGDEKKVASAKKMMRYAIIALIVGTLSGSIIILVGSFNDYVSNQKQPTNLCKTDSDCNNIVQGCGTTNTCKCNPDGSCTIY